ncbi:MAG: class I mannose-6-phosphate isomerase [Thermoleophilaceae bacterium]
MRPIVLPPNGIPRFYRGGPGIAALRGTPPEGDRVPEDWVGSMTTVFGDESLGLSRLPDGTILRDAATADPVAFFGPAHAAQRGADPGLLVKLLDAGERLPVHVHPDDAFARAELGTPYGKTEAWVVIEAAPGANVGVGFRDDLSHDTLERWVRDQNVEAMLGSLNRVDVRPGDAIFVPAGVAHAIGAGVLIVELQEPTDLSVLLEWQGFADPDGDEATLGLGWDTAIRCVQLERSDPSKLVNEGHSGHSLLPRSADGFFRAERVESRSSAGLERGFAILVVTEGDGALACDDGEPLPVRRGDSVLLPWSAGHCRLDGDLVALACRPPGPVEEAAA